MAPTFRMPGILGDICIPKVDFPPFGPPRLICPPPPPPKVQQGFFVERLPGVIRKFLKTTTLADQCMDAWITQNRNDNPADGLVGPICHCIMETKKVKDWPKTKKFKAGAPNFVLFDPKLLQNVIDTIAFIFDHAPNLMETTFPDISIPAAPPGSAKLVDFSRNDKDWATQLEKWRVGQEDDGSTALDLDELGFILGNYNWCWFYTGVAKRFQQPATPVSVDPTIYNRDLIKVTFKQVGIYMVDKYDFVNRGTLQKALDQPLGFWNVDAGQEDIQQIPWPGGPSADMLIKNRQLCKDAGYYPPMGLCYVTNDVMNCYRNKMGNRGCDFLMYSTVEFLEFKAVHYYNQRTKKIVELTKPEF